MRDKPVGDTHPSGAIVQLPEERAEIAQVEADRERDQGLPSIHELRDIAAVGGLKGGRRAHQLKGHMRRDGIQRGTG
jgi:hypothetical protein